MGYDPPGGPPRKDTRTAVVVGAGIVGVSAAVRLQRDGHRVVLVDRLDPGEGASFGNGGVLASCAVLPVTGPGLPRGIPRLLLSRDSPLFLRWSYMPRLAPWLIRYVGACGADETRRIAGALLPLIGDSLEEHRALARGTPAGRWLKPSDYIYVYPDRAAFETEAFGWSVRRDLGFAWEELGPEALAAREPLLSPAFRFGVALGGHGHVTDPGRYVKDLAIHVERNGGRILQAEVADIVVEGGCARGVVAGGERLAADAVVVATGAWSGPLARRLGREVPLESERGYHVELLEPSAMLTGPIMVATGKFVATPMEGRIRLAGFLEFGGLEAPPNAKAFARLERLARTALPGLTWRGTSRWMGHRPAPVDSIPVIGGLRKTADVYLGFGHHHVGLTGGPKAGRLLADLVAGRRPDIDLASYRPDRFDAPKCTGRMT
jgi:D-amino-acid dehydrogenase